MRDDGSTLKEEAGMALVRQPATDAHLMKLNHCTVRGSPHKASVVAQLSQAQCKAPILLTSSKLLHVGGEHDKRDVTQMSGRVTRVSGWVV